MRSERPAAEPRWLNESELETWKAFNAVLFRLPALVDGQLQRDAGLTFFEYLVLAGLSESAGGTLRLSSLAAITNGSLSRLSHVVKRLEARGWVRRETVTEDGRRYTYGVLTDQGRDVLVTVAPGHVENVRSLVFDTLGPDRLEQLRDISLRLLDAMGASPDLPLEKGN